jgi:hypothetical protein
LPRDASERQIDSTTKITDAVGGVAPVGVPTLQLKQPEKHVCTIYVERERKNENRYACMLNRKSKEREN